MVKAWMIYLMALVIIPLTLVSMVEGTGKGFGYDLESAVAETAILGGIMLVIYYSIKRSKNKIKSEI